MKYLLGSAGSVGSSAALAMSLTGLTKVLAGLDVFRWINGLAEVVTGLAGVVTRLARVFPKVIAGVIIWLA